MGTLTAGQPRLDHYCDHKLPTSCRLSSLGECCACKDERAHAATYSTYIDGIGYVSRGVRWARYCWYCRQYWENRVAVSGLPPTQTRIPEVPDQTGFLARWYEFHQGYRIVTKDDGTEERVAVLGEEFCDVDPGVLPRTLEELRAGRERSEAEEREQLEATRQQREREALEQATPAGPSIEDTLDQLLQSASLDDDDQSRETTPTIVERASQRQLAESHVVGNSIHAQAIVPAGTRNREYQARRIAALRRELHRMRSGIERVISGLRELGEDVPDHTDASNRLTDLGRTLDTISGIPDQQATARAIDGVNALTDSTAATQSDRALANLQSRVDEARHHVDDARRNRDQAATELDLAERELRTSQSRVRQLQNEQRTTENYMRLFGSREEMAAQGETYQSPIGGMFERAYERFRTAEEVRREERTLRQVLEAEERSGGEEAATRLAELEAQERDVWGVPQSRTTARAIIESQQPVVTENAPSMPFSRSTDGRDLRDIEGDLHLDADEVGLEQYYSLLRRQGWSSERSTVESTVSELESDQLPPEELDVPEIVAASPGHQLDSLPHVNNDRGRDALFVLSALSRSESLRSHLPGNLTVSFIERLLRGVRGSSLNFTNRQNIESIMEDTDVIWGCGLPAERLRRRRQRGERACFHEMAFSMASAGSVIVHDIEIMAEAFQLSAHIRRLSGLHLSEQVRMLVRLQRGERASEDRTVLFRMLQNESTFSRAKHVHEDQFGRLARNREVHELAADLDRERQQTAREGDYSRLELDAQRRATQALAMAAGRVAMQATPAELLERLADRDETTRAAYERLQANGFTPATMSTRQFRTVYRPLNLDEFAAAPPESDSEDSDEGAKGLDAKDTGRPEQPLSDEELNVKLDCQICYTQLADIACLPCGHLVMCKWCSDQHSPTMVHDRTRPSRAAACPVCRKQIRQKVRVFRP